MSEPAGWPAGQRILALDVMRGIAVLGILAMNIVVFGLPEQAAISPARAGGDTGADLIVWLLAFLFVDGKMRGLFALLFGASMLILAERSEATGRDPFGAHLTRMGWLALFGLLHFYLIWQGDILFTYAAIGCLAFGFRGLSPGRLLLFALLIYGIGFLMHYFGSYGPMLELQSQALRGAPWAMDAYAELMAHPYYSGAVNLDEQDAFRGGYADNLAYRWHEMGWRPFRALYDAIFDILPMMMIGMAILKSGIVVGRWSARQLTLAGFLLLAIGLAGQGAMAATAMAADFDFVLMLNITFAWSLFPRLLMTVGYVLLIVAWLQPKQNEGGVVRWLSAAGRMAFSNYIGTSLLMTAIFYGWGLGLFDRLSRAELYLFVPLGWAVMLAGSVLWLSRFRNGPLEWAWRSLSQKKIAPARK